MARSILVPCSYYLCFLLCFLYTISAFSEDGKRRNRTTDPVKLSSSGFKLQTECLFYVYHIYHCVGQNVSFFSFIVDTIVKRYSTLAVLPKKLHAFIAGIIRARARIADAITRFAFRTRLMAIITRRTVFAANRVNFP